MGRDHTAEPHTLADRLEAALQAAGLSRRGLAVQLAGGTADKTQIERWRKQVRRMLSGDQLTVHQTTAERLSEVLDVPVRYWPTERAPRPENPLSVASDLLMQLDGGSPIPADVLQDVAAAVEETAALAGQLAARLREAASDRRLLP